jgi:hypothetical protein
LNAYSHRFKRTDSAQCPACRFHTESPQHFLLDCPADAHERWPLTTGKNAANKEYAKLLGNGCKTIAIIDFIQSTGILSIDNT